LFGLQIKSRATLLFVYYGSWWVDVFPFQCCNLFWCLLYG
jgi:hypothetical protein